MKLEPVNKGGITYQCPMPMSEREREFKAIKFIVSSCLEKDRTMRFYDALANELLDAYQYQVNSFFKIQNFKQLIHKTKLKGKEHQKENRYS